jgi:hypothetical protein
MTSCSTSACGTGDWDGPRPGDPDNNVTLSATPAFGGIDVSWTYPTTNPEAVAYVELYRGISSTFSNAILLATVGGNFFYDKSTNAQLIEYFYWIKIVSVNGTVGAVIGPASAVAKPPIATVIEQLTGRIDAGLLAQSLKTDIDRITLNYAELSQEIQDRISANNVFSMGLEQLQLTVEEATTYLTEEITSRQDGDSALLSQVNLIAAANATNQAAIQTEQTARVTADSAISQSVTQLSTQVNNPTTGLPATRAVLLNDYYTKTTTDSAIATAVNALGSQVTSTLTGYTNTATLTQNYYTKSATDSAISNATSTLVSTTALNTTLGSYQTKAALQQDYYTKTSTDSAIANAVSSLVSTTALNTALGSYTTTSVLGQNFYTKTQTDSAISSATLNLVSTTELTNALVPYATNAAISQNYYTKTQTDSAIASATTTFMSSTQVNGAITSALTPYTTTAALQTNYYTKTATDSAISSAITTSQSTLNGNIASAQTNLQTNINTVDGKVTAIGARYTAVVSVNGLIGGFGVYNDGSTIQAGFDVDEFWVGNTQANKRKPFIISGGVTYIDEAAIEKLTFSKLRDESGSFIVENGKVKADYLNVIRITGGAYTGYAWPPEGQQGFYLGPGGLLLGNANNGRYVQITENGDFYTPGFSVVNGNATFSGSVSGASGTFSGSLTASAINAVNTINIAGNAVTVPVSAFTAGEFRNSEFGTWQDAQTIVITTSGSRVYIASSANILTGVGEVDDSGGVAFVTTYRLVRDSTVLMQSSSPSMSYSETGGAGTYTYRLQCITTYPFSASITYFYGGASNRSLFVIETKR